MTKAQWAAGVQRARRCWSASFNVGLLMSGCSCGAANVGLGVGLPLTLCGEPWPLLVDERGDGLCDGRAVPAGEGLPCGVRVGETADDDGTGDGVRAGLGVEVGW